jgi:hypothetical protein
MEDEDEWRDDFWNSTVNTSSSCKQFKSAIKQLLREGLEGVERALFRAETQKFSNGVRQRIRLSWPCCT